MEPTSDLDSLIEHLESDLSLFEPDQLRKRLETLDTLEAHFGNLDPALLLAAIDRTRIFDRADLFRNKLEAANAVIYNSIHDQIKQGVPPSRLRQWIERCSDKEKPQPGLSYDHLDELISGVLQASEP